MAITLATVTGPVALPDDTHPEKAAIKFTLIRVDAEDDTIVVTEPVIVPLDAAGDFSVDLWVNDGGTRATYYRVDLILGTYPQRAVHIGFCEVPASASALDLSDLLVNDPPPGVDLTAWLASIEASEAAAAASAATAVAAAAALDGAADALLARAEADGWKSRPSEPIHDDFKVQIGGTWYSPDWIVMSVKWAQSNPKGNANSTNGIKTGAGEVWVWDGYLSRDGSNQPVLVPGSTLKPAVLGETPFNTAAGTPNNLAFHAAHEISVAEGRPVVIEMGALAGSSVGEWLPATGLAWAASNQNTLDALSAPGLWGDEKVSIYITGQGENEYDLGPTLWTLGSSTYPLILDGIMGLSFTDPQAQIIAVPPVQEQDGGDAWQVTRELVYLRESGRYSNFFVIPTDGLKLTEADTGLQVHYDGASYVTIGRRIADIRLGRSSGVVGSVEWPRGVTDELTVGGKRHILLADMVFGDNSADLDQIEVRANLVDVPIAFDLRGGTILQNGDFAAATGWTAGGGWAIGSGVATHTAGSASTLSQAVTPTAGIPYRVTLTISGLTEGAGSVTARFTGGTTVSSVVLGANNTFTFHLTAAAGNTAFEIVATSGFDGSVDNVTVQADGIRQMLTEGGLRNVYFEVESPATERLKIYAEAAAAVDQPLMLNIGAAEPAGDNALEWLHIPRKAPVKQIYLTGATALKGKVLAHDLPRTLEVLRLQNTALDFSDFVPRDLPPDMTLINLNGTPVPQAVRQAIADEAARRPALTVSSSGSAPLDEEVFPEDFGATGDGTANDTTAMVAFAARGGRLALTPGKTYRTSEAVFTGGTRLQTNGAKIEIIATTPSTYTAAHLLFGDNCRVEGGLYIEGAATASGVDGVHARDGFWCDLASFVSDGAEVSTNGLKVEGGFTHVGHIHSVGWTRPFIADAELVDGAGAVKAGLTVGGHYMEDVTRGFRLIGQERFNIAPGVIYVRSAAAAAEAAGYNGFLLDGARKGIIGDQYIADSGEHAIRCAGAFIEDISFGHLTIERASSASFKMNCATNVRPKGISVAGMTIIDPCYETGTSGAASQIIRISHTDGFVCGPVYLRETGDFTLTAGTIIAVSNSSGVYFGPVVSTLSNAWRPVQITDQNDLSGDTIVGCHNINIERLEVPEPASGSYVDINMQEVGGTVGDINIGFDIRTARGAVPLFNVTNATAGYDGKFRITGHVTGLIGADFDDILAAGVEINVTTGAGSVISRPTFNRLNGADAALFLRDLNGTRGSGNYGQAIAFSQIAGGRPGAAIAAVQTNTDADQIGLGFFVHPLSASSDELSEAMRLLHSGPLDLLGSNPQYRINGTKVVGAQGAALPADATDLATAITLVNAIKARMVAHGLVAT